MVENESYERCGLCNSRGWIVPEPLSGDYGKTVVPMRCQCHGGPEALARIVQKDDYQLANLIRKQFAGVDPTAYKYNQVFKSQVKATPSKVVSHADKTSEADW